MLAPHSRLQKRRPFHRSQPPPPPRDGEVECESAAGPHYAGPLYQASKLATAPQIALPPSDAEVYFESAAGPNYVGPLAGLECGDSFTDRLPPPRDGHYAGPLSKLRTRRPFHRSQPPRDGEVYVESAAGPHYAAPLAGFESGDSFTNRSPPPPPAMARSTVNPRRGTGMLPSPLFRKWRYFHRSQPPRDGDV